MRSIVRYIRPQRQRARRFAVLALAAALPIGCVAPAPPANPFAGAWTTADRQQIAFRDNTILVNPPNAQPSAMDAESCAGAFRFGYGRKSREALIGLAPHQPDLRGKLESLLARPAYPVAELTCGEGDSTYVLLDERDLVAIHRDRDIAGIERLSRL
jgi:hypothetical protein